MAARISFLETDKLKERFLQCGVCMETFNEEERYPLLLPCLHSFCCKCLASLPKDENLECPLCRANHQIHGDNISFFPKDNTRQDLLDFVRVTAKENRIPCGLCDENQTATHRCQECECFICKTCKQMHEKMKTFKHHWPVSLKAISDGPIDQLQYFRRNSCCKVPDHENEQLKMYCSSPCNTTICTLCAIMNHRDHTILNIGEVYQKDSESIQRLCNEVHNKISETERIIADVNSEIVKFSQEANKEKMEAKAAIANAITILQRRAKKLSEEIDRHESTKVKILETQKEHLQLYVDSCVEANQFLEQSLAHKNKPAFLEISKTIHSRLHELKSTHHNKIPQARVSSLKFQSNGLYAMEFQNLTNTLGKVLCTDVYVPNSRFQHYGERKVGKELHFKIKIKNLHGMTINSEVVEIRMAKPHGQNHFLKCVYVDADKTYRAGLIPEDSGIFTITFMSNGIDLEVKSPKTIKIEIEQLPPVIVDAKQVEQHLNSSSRGSDESSSRGFKSGRTRFYSTPLGTEHYQVITKSRSQSTPPILQQYQIQVVTTVTTGLENLSIISCLGTEQAWVSQGNSKDMMLIDTNSCVIETVISNSQFSPYDMAVNKQNILVFCDSDHSVWKGGPSAQTKNIINLSSWSPKGICITSNGDLLLCMTLLSTESKVVRYRGSAVIQEIKKSKDRDLYGTQDLYVAENKNKDVWVSDVQATALVVTDKSGELKFKYSRESQPKMLQNFCPRCIDSDSSGHILVIDTGKKCVHVIDNKGQLMIYIGNLSNPRGLSVDAHDRVWICELSGKVKIVNYLRY